MPQPERYFIGPNVREKLTEVFTRVGGMAAGSGGQTPGVFLQDIQRPGGSGGSSVSIGTYGTAGAQWEKGATLTVHEYELSATEGAGYSIVPKYSDGSPVNVTVLNLFVTIPPNYDTVRYCAYASVGGVNLLIAAEC